jgi:hypothetical protein
MPNDQPKPLPPPQPARQDPPTSDTIAKAWLNDTLQKIEQHCGADALTIYGPIQYGVDHRVRIAVEALEPRRNSLLVIIDTPGGIVETTERIVKTLRHYYEEVKFIVPDRAMSAGTVLVMSGDAILMDHFSCLGPVDPQLPKEDRLVPALSYLEQFERLKERSAAGELTSAELVLLQELDLAELHQYELARDLSVQLIQDWLAQYKFKDWKNHSSTGLPVTPEEKAQRAKEIAEALNKHTDWGSHSRGIHRDTLEATMRLKIDSLEADSILSQFVKEYFWFFRDFLAKAGVVSCVHSRNYL